MKMTAALFATLAAPAFADQIRCDLDGVAVAFDLDRAQFAPPVDDGEPPRRRLTSVTMGNAQFPAEPFIIADAIGFSAEGMGGSEIMMVIQADSSAMLADPRADMRLSGTCEVNQ